MPTAEDPRPTSENEVLHVGVVGVGDAGAAAVQRLLEVGYQVGFVDVNPTAGRDLVASGAHRFGTSRELAAFSSRCIVFVPDDVAAVDVVANSEDGILSSAAAMPLVVMSSTVRPETCRVLAEKVAQAGGFFIDAPFTGGSAAARRGELTLLVGGSEEAVSLAGPLLSSLATSIHHLGGVGAGALSKLLTTSIHWGQAAVIVEAFRVAKAAGISPLQLRKALLGTSVDGGTLQRLEHTGYRWHEKDLASALESSTLIGAHMPVTRIVADAMLSINPLSVRELLLPPIERDS